MPSPASLDALVETRRAAGVEPRWRHYAEYCRLRALGLRREALQALDTFVADAANWSLAERVAFAKWVGRAADHESNSLCLPHPLIHGLLAPAVAEQAELDPADAEAQLLLAIWGDPSGGWPVDRYLAAIGLDPANAMISRIFVRAVLEWTGYAQHELPHGYLGDPGADAELLELAIASMQASGLDTPEREPLERMLGLARAAAAAGVPGACISPPKQS
jgi:hypothetical protein